MIKPFGYSRSGEGFQGGSSQIKKEAGSGKNTCHRNSSATSGAGLA